MIYIKSDFIKKEVALILADDAGAKFADKNSFSFIDFKGKKIKAGAKDKLTKYLFDKAVEAGGVPVDAEQKETANK